MMQTQVLRISIQHAVDPVEHSRVSVSLIVSGGLRYVVLLSFVLLGCCGVCPNIHLSILEAS